MFLMVQCRASPPTPSRALIALFLRVGIRNDNNGIMVGEFRLGLVS